MRTQLYVLMPGAAASPTKAQSRQAELRQILVKKSDEVNPLRGSIAGTEG